MGLNQRVPICLKARRAVVERWAAARRVLGRIDIIQQKGTEPSGPITRSFRSLTPPKTRSPSSQKLSTCAIFNPMLFALADV